MSRILVGRETDALIGHNLRRQREDLGLPIEAVAPAAGLTVGTLHAAEAGDRHLCGAELLQLVDCLRCPFAALFAAPLPPRIPS